MDPTVIISHRTADLGEGPSLYKTFRAKEDGCVKVVMFPHGIIQVCGGGQAADTARLTSARAQATGQQPKGACTGHNEPKCFHTMNV